MTTTIKDDDYILILSDEELDNENFVDLHIMKADTNERIVSLTVPIKELARAVAGFVPEHTNE